MWPWPVEIAFISPVWRFWFEREKRKKRKKLVLPHFKVDLQPRVGSPRSWDWLKTLSCQTNGIFLTLTTKKEKNQPYLNRVPLLEAALCSVSVSQHSFVPLHSHLFHLISPTTVSCRGAVLCRRSSFKPPISFSSLTFPPYIHFPSPVFYPCPFCVSLCPFFSLSLCSCRPPFTSLPHSVSFFCSHVLAAAAVSLRKLNVATTQETDFTQPLRFIRQLARGAGMPADTRPVALHQRATVPPRKRGSSFLTYTNFITGGENK